MDKIYDYTIKLIRYILKGDVPSLPENIDFEKLYTFGKSHGVENMLYVALRDLKIDVPKDVMQKFYYSYLMSIKIDTLQTMELEKIGNAFEEAGIDYIPLKGSVVKHFYPMTHYRKSGDIDVLVRRETEKDAEKVLIEKLNYLRSEISEHYEVHISYFKMPCVYVELHRQILKSSNRAYKMFKNIWKYVKTSKSKEHKYVLSNELLYTYLLAHLCNHLYNGGAGIRMLMDFYVLSKNSKLDYEILNRYLKKANLVKINDYVTNIISKWFGDSYVFDKDVEILLDIIFDGGSFGTRDMQEKIHDSNSLVGKIRQLMQRVFMPTNMLVQIKPEYANGTKSKFLIQLRRIKNILKHNRKKVFDDTKLILKSEKSDKSLANIVKAICDR